MPRGWHLLLTHEPRAGLLAAPLGLHQLDEGALAEDGDGAAHRSTDLLEDGRAQRLLELRGRRSAGRSARSSSATCMPLSKDIGYRAPGREELLHTGVLQH